MAQLDVTNISSEDDEVAIVSVKRSAEAQADSTRVNSPRSTRSTARGSDARINEDQVQHHVEHQRDIPQLRLQHQHDVTSSYDQHDQHDQQHQHDVTSQHDSQVMSPTAEPGEAVVEPGTTCS
eukprot:4847279-Amphidinium_carterae.2